MLRLAMLLLFMSLNSFANTTWQQEVKLLLPVPLSKFVSDKTPLKEVNQALGKASLIKGNKHYWERGGLKYALEVTFKSGKFLTLHFTFTGKRPAYGDLLDKIKLEEFKPYPISGRSAGRFLKYEEKGAEIILDPLSKTIYSVRLP